MAKLFGTDGMRGAAGRFPLDEATIHIVGRSLARLLKEQKASEPFIIMGRDTRESGPWIEAALTSGAREAGARVRSAGIITTPGVAFLARHLQADAGVVISASHNPYHDNGIKIFAPTGRKLDDKLERRIEADIEAEAYKHTSADSDAKTTTEPNAQEEDSLRKLYLDYLIKM